ncbi:DUF4038 domain-containing protein [Pelagicoccus mobilis]|uniref:DUF4038 domain-containing protein n=2 Tax=Pelagicoccus mobilis TaxID=415221 RepID=A0A934VQV0_9BACT|nr:DUF4038 domain-containing protein [Pelagicoccus mobilis]
MILTALTSLSHAGDSLSISEDGRYFEDEKGDTFFWLGDTAWELFHRLSYEESELYLKTRKEQGFNVVQAVVLAELKGLDVPNANGDLPLIDKDPARPNEAYFQHVDRVVDLANSLGIRMALLPMWGDKWNLKWGVGPEVFTPENAETYGLFLGARYADRNVIWVLGGDRNPEEPEDSAITRALAKGIESGDGGRHLMTYHPQGGYSSSDFFQEDTWLDFHMFQSGHAPSIFPNFKKTESDRALLPVRPVLDAEPMYEDHPIDWKPEKGWYDEFECRRAAYWSVLKGAAGHTYGNHNIWQMWQPGRDPISAARTPWREALRWPGAFQAGYMKNFFESFEWWSLSPVASELVVGPAEEEKTVVAAATEGLELVVAYTPFGNDFSLNLDWREGSLYSLSWYNPQDGQRVFADPVKIKGGSLALVVPGNEIRGNDWVAVLERQ